MELRINRVRINRSGPVHVNFLGICVLLSQQYESILCQLTHAYRDRKYLKVNMTLTEIPTTIPAHAVEVHLSMNKITHIGANAFSNLSQCTKLELGWNDISGIEPDAFNGLISLKLLRLHHNEVERLNVNMFFSLKNCTELDVINNQISEIETGSFNGLSNLGDLRLSGNQLTILKADTFLGLLAVEELLVGSNIINTIEDNTFVNLKKLRLLWLDNNRLKILSPGTFSGLESLEHLTLEFNHLTTLPADVFSHLPRPLSLGLQDAVHCRMPDNLPHCDAALCWLKQEELNGTITWYFHGDYPLFPYKPRCRNGINWDTWKCEGNILFIVLGSSVK